MIQRIQTVYLLVAGLMMASLLKLKLADLVVNEEIYSFIAQGVFHGDVLIFSGLPLMILIGIIIILHVVAIFMYKKRIRQIRLIVFTMILMLGLTGVFYFFIYSGFDEVKVSFKIPVIFPVVAVVLDYLAIRAIGKDEALIRSLNRIR